MDHTHVETIQANYIKEICWLKLRIRFLEGELDHAQSKEANKELLCVRCRAELRGGCAEVVGQKEVMRDGGLTLKRGDMEEMLESVSEVYGSMCEVRRVVQQQQAMINQLVLLNSRIRTGRRGGSGRENGGSMAAPLLYPASKLERDGEHAEIIETCAGSKMNSCDISDAGLIVGDGRGREDEIELNKTHLSSVRGDEASTDSDQACASSSVSVISSPDSGAADGEDRNTAQHGAGTPGDTHTIPGSWCEGAQKEAHIPSDTRFPYSTNSNQHDTALEYWCPMCEVKFNKQQIPESYFISHVNSHFEPSEMKWEMV